MAFEPNFQILATTAKALMAIESSRSAIESLPVSPLSTHYSTQIEGNRLTLPEVEKVIAGSGGFPGRERDEKEVSNYYLAAGEAEKIAGLKRPFSREDIQTLHGLAFEGRAKPTPYRDGQNVIRDGSSGSIVYMPPEAKDVPASMEELLDWINHGSAGDKLPLPVIAGLAHYQFATIHPYYDGNGRTARLLTTMILQRCGLRA